MMDSIKGKILVSFDDILKLASQKGASDVHLKAGIIPVIRKHGQLKPLSSSYKPLSSEDLENIAYSLMNDRQQEHFEKHMDVDLSYGLQGAGRFRINILKQRGTFRMVIRHIPDKVPSLEELNLPEVVFRIADNERGLILVTGATGSGKSSTMAGIIDYINRNKSKHILMIEDPTEYLIKDRKSIITQRELGNDTHSYAASLKAALRQDPDVILIGEMRDRETIEIALLAAETGHLVISTTHTLDAQETINRILASFDPGHQLQIRMQLASVLRSVVSQRLCPKANGLGYVPALEILVNNSRVAECIENPSRTSELRSIMEESTNSWGMCTFDQSLMNLLNDDQITYEVALKTSTSPENFAIRYSGVEHGEQRDNEANSTLRARLEEQWRNLTVVDVENINPDLDIGPGSKRPPGSRKKKVQKSESKRVEKKPESLIPPSLFGFKKRKRR